MARSSCFTALQDIEENQHEANISGMDIINDAASDPMPMMGITLGKWQSLLRMEIKGRGRFTQTILGMIAPLH